jgi:hypothetical protein
MATDCTALQRVFHQLCFFWFGDGLGIQTKSDTEAAFAFFLLFP